MLRNKYIRIFLIIFSYTLDFFVTTHTFIIKLQIEITLKFSDLAKYFSECEKDVNSFIEFLATKFYLNDQDQKDFSNKIRLQFLTKFVTKQSWDKRTCKKWQYGSAVPSVLLFHFCSPVGRPTLSYEECGDRTKRRRGGCRTFLKTKVLKKSRKPTLWPFERKPKWRFTHRSSSVLKFF